MATSVTTVTTNKDIDYVQKDFTSSEDAMISFANVNFGPGTSANRLWTNFNVDSFSRNWLEIVAFIADVFFFYFDNQATQSYLQTATVLSAVQNIAQQFGFTPATATSASGVATFTTTGAVTIPRGFRVSSTTGEQFFVTSNIVASSAGQFSGTVLQGIIVTDNFVAQGLQNEEFNLTGPNVIADLNNINTQDISPQISVNGNSYTLVNTFIRNNGLDQPPVVDSLGNIIGGGGRVFELLQRPNGTPFIRFGDGVFGRRLVAGEAIVALYRTGGGSAGNIGAQTLTTLVDSNPSVTAVTNAAAFSGGADQQSIDQLRSLIPASLRTLQRAVSTQDYSDLLVSSFSQVFAAAAEANTTTPGVDLNVYVVPQGAGITPISANPLLENTLSNFIDRRKMVTTQFQILDAFGIGVLISIEAFLTDTASKTTVIQSIDTALSNFFSLTTGGPSGSGVGFAEQILLKDITNVIETISGIQRFEIKMLTYRPRVQDTVIGLTTKYVNSPVSIFPNVSQSEWLLAASGQLNETAGTVLFSNTSLVSYTYTSGTGVIQYSLPVDLTLVGPQDLFRDGAGIDFTIFAVDVLHNKITLATGQTVNTTVGSANSGSIRDGGTAFQSFKCFKKILANATNLSINSITDNNLDLSVLLGTGASIAARILLDNSNVFVPGEFSTGAFYLVDSTGNIWEILANDSNTLTTSITAVNDATITTVASGPYKIVQKLIGAQIVFNNNIFNIQFNSDNTLFSIGAQFNQIGTIGEAFQISKVQTNIGNLGVPIEIISYNSSTKTVQLNGTPDLQGVNTTYHVIDSSGQIFNVVGANNASTPSTSWPATNQNTSFLLKGSGLGSQVAQGFKVPSTAIYSVVAFNLERRGNIVGNLVARIVNDAGGLPDLTSPVAVSNSIAVTSIPKDVFNLTLFTFTVPPSLTAGTQYHLVLSPDAAYDAAQTSGVTIFSNTGLVGFTYSPVSGVVTYSSAVTLTGVIPGHYFRDGAGNIFSILAVNASTFQLTLATGLTVNNTVTTPADGSVIRNDDIQVGLDTALATYPNGEFSRYNGTLWSNSTLGPSPTGMVWDAIFEVAGTKSLIVNSNLTPANGLATVSTRYYDDSDEISLIVGISKGSVTSATDVNAAGRGTVAGNPNRQVDQFVFRSSRNTDDIVNLRANEIPQLSTSDIQLSLFGGVS